MACLLLVALTQVKETFQADKRELIWHALIYAPVFAVVGVSYLHVQSPLLVDVLYCGLNFVMMFGVCWLRKAQCENDKGTVLPPTFLTIQLVVMFAMTLQMTSNYLVGSVCATIAF